MHKFVIVLILLNLFLFGSDLNKVNGDKNSERVRFIDNIYTDDPELDSIIEKIRSDFLFDRKIRENEHKANIEALRIEKKKNMKTLVESYKMKIKDLMERYPDKIYHKKGKDESNQMKYTKPMSKDDPNYRGPRRPDKNKSTKTIKELEKLDK